MMSTNKPGQSKQANLPVKVAEDSGTRRLAVAAQDGGVIGLGAVIVEVTTGLEPHLEQTFLEYGGYGLGYVLMAAATIKLLKDMFYRRKKPNKNDRN
jgi:hypothetical protein